MEERIHYTRVSPGAYRVLSALEKYLSECGLVERLLNLLRDGISPGIASDAFLLIFAMPPASVS